MVEKNPDTIILAGDIYDRAAPPKEAMTLLIVSVSCKIFWKKSYPHSW